MLFQRYNIGKYFINTFIVFTQNFKLYFTLISGKWKARLDLGIYTTPQRCVRVLAYTSTILYLSTNWRCSVSRPHNFIFYKNSQWHPLSASLAVKITIIFKGNLTRINYCQTILEFNNHFLTTHAHCGAGHKDIISFYFGSIWQVSHFNINSQHPKFISNTFFHTQKMLSLYHC
jgi:hypothetical protein